MEELINQRKESLVHPAATSTNKFGFKAEDFWILAYDAQRKIMTTRVNTIRACTKLCTKIYNVYKEVNCMQKLLDTTVLAMTSCNYRHQTNVMVIL